MFLVILPKALRSCFLLLLWPIPVFALPLYNNISGFVFLMIWFRIWVTWDFETYAFDFSVYLYFVKKKCYSSGKLCLRTNLFMTLQLFLSKILGIWNDFRKSSKPIKKFSNFLSHPNFSKSVSFNRGNMTDIL